MKRPVTDESRAISPTESKAEQLKTAANKPYWSSEKTEPVKIKCGLRRFDTAGNGEVDKAGVIAVLQARTDK